MKQTHQLAKTTALLLGFVTSFVFLLAFFINLGIAIESIFIVGVFFVTLQVIIAMLLGSTKEITQ
ncbi:MAG: hypothetical protein QM541_15460 [Flavobacterium sp.]|nr:hypothetical protein [Flavobacterium sp.]